MARKTMVRQLLSTDKKAAMSDRLICVACFDLEKTLTTPRCYACSSYWRRKLNVHNFIIDDLSAHQGVYNVWNETIAAEGANEINSCIWKFIEKPVRGGVKEFRFDSDVVHENAIECCMLCITRLQRHTVSSLLTGRMTLNIYLYVIKCFIITEILKKFCAWILQIFGKRSDL